MNVLNAVLILMANTSLPVIGTQETDAASQTTKVPAFYHKAMAVADLIRQCPDMSHHDPSDKEKKQILACLARISMEPVETIREAEKIYSWSEKDSKTVDVVAVYTRLFLLHRYIFKVPEVTPEGRGIFGGFAGIPFNATKKTYNSLWPFSKDKNGALIITGKFAGYYGAPYSYLDEFDYFKVMYGMRRIP